MLISNIQKLYMNKPVLILLINRIPHHYVSGLSQHTLPSHVHGSMAREIPYQGD